MKPTIKIIVAATKPDLGTAFVQALSDTELTMHERKVANPLSATKEEATLPVMVGRVEWEDVAVQMLALTAYKRYDFVWPALLREIQGVLVTVEADGAEAMDDVQHLLRLFSRLTQLTCVVTVSVPAASDARLLADIEARSAGAYPVVGYSLADRSSLAVAVRTLLGRLPAAE